MIEVNGTVLRLKHLIAYLENRCYNRDFSDDGIIEGDYMSIGFSYPFSWRGSYDEVAFAITNFGVDEISLIENQIMIGAALIDNFRGYKGGFYKYDPETPVNFEANLSDYTNLGYLSGLIEVDSSIETMLHDMIDKFKEN